MRIISTISAGLLAISFTLSAHAQAVRIKPMETQAAKTKLELKAEKAQKSAQSGKTAMAKQALLNSTALSCSMSNFASDVSAGTGFNLTTAESLLKQFSANQGLCGSGLTAYGVDARTNFLKILENASLSLTANTKSVAKLLAASYSQVMNTTVAKGQEAINKMMNDCKILAAAK